MAREVYSGIDYAKLAEKVDYDKIADKIADRLALGAKPEIAYNSVSTANSVIIDIAPPVGQYVYLITLLASVGTDGDQVELQVLDVDGNWRTVLKPKALANTSLVLGFPNLKMDKVKVGGVEYTVKPGDGTTKTLQILSRGTGPWEATLLYFCST